MPFDAFTIKHTTTELQSLLEKAKINKVTQPDKEEIILSMYKNGQSFKLVISTNAKYCGIYTTKYERDNPLVAPNFCMLLRKHILSSEVISIKQVDFERIIIIDLLCKNEFFESVNRQLIVEIMGKYSNICLTENEIILGAIKTASLEVNSLRPTFSGVKYVFPTKQDKINPFEKQKSLEYLEKFSGGDFAQFLFEGFCGLAITTAREIALLFNGNVNIFYDKFVKFLLEPNKKPCCYFTKDYKEFSIVKLNFTQENAVEFNSIIEMEEYFFDKIKLEKDYSYKYNFLLNAINKKIKKIQKKLSSVMDTITSNSDYELNKKKGDLILSNIWKIKKGDKEVICQDFYCDNSEIKIQLDTKLSPQENANRFFKKYNKQKTTLSFSQTTLSEINSENDYLLSIAQELQSCDTLEKLFFIEEEMISYDLIPKNKNIKKQNKTLFCEFLFNGWTILVGRNNLENDTLRAKSDTRDLWFHTKGYHSAFVVCKHRDIPFSNEIIEFCAEICAFNSQNKFGSNIEVDYTTIKNVKKPPSSHPGTVIYVDYKSVLVTPNSHQEYLKK